MFPDARIELPLGRRFTQFATGRIRHGEHYKALHVRAGLIPRDK